QLRLALMLGRSDRTASDAGTVGTCRFTVERADDPTSVSAIPNTVRGHPSLGLVRQAGQQLTDIGRLTAGSAVVDGVRHELTPDTADLVTTSSLPPWELPTGVGPLSPALSDAISDFANGCKVSDGTAQTDPTQDG